MAIAGASGGRPLTPRRDLSLGGPTEASAFLLLLSEFFICVLCLRQVSVLILLVGGRRH